MAIGRKTPGAPQEVLLPLYHNRSRLDQPVTLNSFELDANAQLVEDPHRSPASTAGQGVTAKQHCGVQNVCPTCGRADALLVLDEVTYCVACGYASDGARGCT